MRFNREDLEIEGGRKLYLYTFDERAELDKKQAKLWSRVSEEWKKEQETIEKWFSPVSNEMVRLLGEGPGRLLDLGTGAGSMRFPEEWDLAGLDVTRSILNPKQRVVVGACAPLPIASDSFDAVSSRFTLMLVSDPMAAFGEVHRALKPGGKFVFSVWGTAEENRWSSALTEIVAAKLKTRLPSSDEPHAFRLADSDEVSAMLLSAGFPRSKATRVELPYLHALPKEEAVRHVMRFAGPLRALLERVPEAEREGVLNDLVLASLKEPQMGVAYVWFAEKST